MNLVNHELCMYLAKFSLAIFTDTPKMYLADELTSLFIKFFFANSFHLYGFANNFPRQIFLMYSLRIYGGEYPKVSKCKLRCYVSMLMSQCFQSSVIFIWE